MALYYPAIERGGGKLRYVGRSEFPCGCKMQPVQKTSKCRKRKRRSHHALSAVNVVACPKCGKSKLPHAACANCGYVSAKLTLSVEKQLS